MPESQADPAGTLWVMPQELDAYGICHRGGDLTSGAAATEISGERFAFCRHSLHGGHNQAGGLRLAQVVEHHDSGPDGRQRVGAVGSCYIWS